MNNFIMIKGLIHWRDIKLINLHKCNNIASKYKAKPERTKKKNRETYNNRKL